MHGHLLHVDGTQVEASDEAVGAALDAGSFFWLDITDLGQDGAALLADRFDFHPLAVEDAEHFGQRPKIEQYDEFFYLVVHGARMRGGETVEVHFFYSDRRLVTVRRDACESIDTVRDDWARRTSRNGSEPVMLLYSLVDALVDSFFPMLSEFDDTIDDLEDAILQNPTNEQLGQLFAMKRDLVHLRRVVMPERDMFAGFMADPARLPGMSPEFERYFRDLYDHLIRVSDTVDTYRDLLSEAMDTHLSTVSNRLNEVMKQLTMIATVFLPLSFLTGFFGQNFGWLVARIGSVGAFVGLAIGLEVFAALLLLVLFRRRGWLGGS